MYESRRNLSWRLPKSRIGACGAKEPTWWWGCSLAVYVHIFLFLGTAASVCQWL